MNLHETQIAARFIASFTKSQLDRIALQDCLEQLLNEHILGNGAWHPQSPLRGSAFRCLSKYEFRLCPLLMNASKLTSISFESIPNDFTLWIDPGSVSYRVGSGYVMSLYDSSNQVSESTNYQVSCSPPRSSVVLKHPSSSPPRSAAMLSMESQRGVLVK